MEKTSSEFGRRLLSDDVSNLGSQLDFPEVLRSAANGPDADALYVILRYLDHIQSELEGSCQKYFDPHLIEHLRLIGVGLSKVRQNTMPSQQEMMLISNPDVVFSELAEGLSDFASETVIPVETENFIETQIVEPLIKLSDSLLPAPSRSLVNWWYKRLLLDPKGPWATPLEGPPTP